MIEQVYVVLMWVIIVSLVGMLVNLFRDDKKWQYRFAVSGVGAIGGFPLIWLVKGILYLLPLL